MYSPQRFTIKHGQTPQTGQHARLQCVRVKEITIKSVHTGTLACSKTEIHSLWKNKTLLDLSI